MFYSNVEKWRRAVENAINLYYSSYPEKKSFIYRFIDTFQAQVDIILAIIQNESGGNENAIGDNGNSVGLMQLNYAAGTPQAVGFTGSINELLSPAVNIFYGVKYYFSQVERYKDPAKAILAYNAGSYRLNQAGVPINLQYLKKIAGYFGESAFFLSLPLSAVAYGTLTGSAKKDGSEKTSSPAIGASLDKTEIAIESKIKNKNFFSIFLTFLIKIIRSKIYGKKNQNHQNGNI